MFYNLNNWLTAIINNDMAKFGFLVAMLDFAQKKNDVRASIFFYIFKNVILETFPVINPKKNLVAICGGLSHNLA